MSDRLEKVCKKCGSHLMLREGVNGDFLACPRFPSCRYTESFRNLEDLVWRDKRGGCKACKFTGLLPFTRKDGTIAHDVFYDCSCKEKDLIERYQPLKPCEYDFPMSSDFREFSFDYCGYPIQETERIIEDSGESAELHRQVIVLTGEIKRLSETQGGLVKYITSKKDTNSKYLYTSIVNKGVASDTNE